ncbi:uncharacterized protein LOC130534073 isoform X2 [Takifugu flavidus]|nr:uncharacterized protein LOC130534073 isoform X2 [Takifugu flavidus]XP_056903927.1 uncharacterized protein LOC130534073 isoform X2 [Takifugu flavidus]
MDPSHHQQRLISRSLSEGEVLTSSTASLPLNWSPDRREERDTQQKRRSTLASYVPPSEDQNGSLSEKDMGRQRAKSLGKLNTDEVCRWFTGIGLQKCLPFIREAKLCGADIASASLDLLHTLRISTVEDREQLLSAIYTELHPPTQLTQRLDALLESPNPCDLQTFAAALASMNKSKSSPHVSCLNMRQRSLKLRNKSPNYTIPRSSHLIEITINVAEQIVHLRTPKETTVGKVMDSCIRMLGVTEDRSLFMMTETQGASEKLPSDQLIGSLLKSDNKQLELHLCKIEKPTNTVSHTDPEAKCSGQTSINTAKEERIRELNQQVDALQNAIRQIQQLHHDLVAFCSELKSADGDVSADGLDSAELRQKLELVKGRLSDKKQKVHTLRDHVNVAHEKQLDVHLLEKMKLNCQVFKEEICVVHLNRQVAHLQNALHAADAKEKVQRKNSTIGSLTQLVSLESPAMLLAVHESHGPGGHYGFTCGCAEGRGLVVVEAANSHLCVGDRLVEVNGVPVVGATLKELEDILLQGASAQLVVLRQPPPSLLSQQQPLLLGSDGEAVSIETTPPQKAIAI